MSFRNKVWFDLIAITWPFSADCGIKLIASHFVTNSPGSWWSSPLDEAHHLRKSKMQSWADETWETFCSLAEVEQNTFTGSLVRSQGVVLNRDLFQVNTQEYNHRQTWSLKCKLQQDDWRCQLWWHFKTAMVCQLFNSLHIQTPWWMKQCLYQETSTREEKMGFLPVARPGDVGVEGDLVVSAWWSCFGSWSLAGPSANERQNATSMWTHHLREGPSRFGERQSGQQAVEGFCWFLAALTNFRNEECHLTGG